MEAHHPHHVTHKKKWTEYLLEFFMLFLAVFLGFLAENVRESNAEKAREKEYVSSMVDDLLQDSIKMQEFIPYVTELQAGLDTLVHLCSMYNKNTSDTRKMYYAYHHYCRGWKDLKIYDKTLVQLKSSGNMRIIKKSVADTLSKLDAGIQFYNEQLLRLLDAQNNAVNMGMNIFNYIEYEKANTTNGETNITDEGFLTMTYQPALIQSDPVYLQQFAGRVGFFRNLVISLKGNCRDALPALTHYISYLKNAYHLKE
jgi:hypothetical protein